MQVVLYGESLCPSCKYFVENVVAPMFDEGLNKDLFRFRYFAYGNARNQSRRECSNLQSLDPGRTAGPAQSLDDVVFNSPASDSVSSIA